MVEKNSLRQLPENLLLSETIKFPTIMDTTGFKDGEIIRAMNKHKVSKSIKK
jgi:hypothetical protein